MLGFIGFIMLTYNLDGYILLSLVKIKEIYVWIFSNGRLSVVLKLFTLHLFTLFLKIMNKHVYIPLIEFYVRLTYLLKMQSSAIFTKKYRMTYQENLTGESKKQDLQPLVKSFYFFASRNFHR